MFFHSILMHWPYDIRCISCPFLTLGPLGGCWIFLTSHGNYLSLHLQPFFVVPKVSIIHPLKCHALFLQLWNLHLLLVLWNTISVMPYNMFQLCLCLVEHHLHLELCRYYWFQSNHLSLALDIIQILISIGVRLFVSAFFIFASKKIGLCLQTLYITTHCATINVVNAIHFVASLSIHFVVSLSIEHLQGTFTQFLFFLTPSLSFSQLIPKIISNYC